jgi:hypothetical protein
MSAKSYLDERKKEALVEKAIEYRERYGMSVFPVGNPKAELPNKVPNFPWGNLTKSRLPTKMLQEQMGKWSVTGVGVVMGKSSGNLACRDFDTEESYAEWVSKSHRIAATTPTVKTRRGYHVYFRTPQRRSYRDCVAYRHPSQAGEYRGNNCICVLPPSLHPSGVDYQWLHSPEDLGGFPIIDPEEEGLMTEALEYEAERIAEGIGDSEGEEGGGVVVEGVRNTQGGIGSFNVPLARTARRALSRSESLPDLDSMERLLVRHRPPMVGCRNRSLHDLYVDLRLRFPRVRPEGLEPAVYRWFELSQDVIGTKQWSITRGEFFDLCRRKPNVRPDPLDVVAIGPAERAFTSGPLWMPDTHEFRSLPPIDRVKSLCRHLAAIAPSGDFYLGGRRAGAETGVPHRTAARILTRLVERKWLAVVRAGVRGRSTSDKPLDATYYRIVGDGAGDASA